MGEGGRKEGFTNDSEKKETINQETIDPGNHRPKYFMAW